MVIKQFIQSKAIRDFIRKKSTDNKRSLTAPPSNIQLSYIYISIYMSTKYNDIHTFEQ